MFSAQFILCVLLYFISRSWQKYFYYIKVCDIHMSPFFFKWEIFSFAEKRLDPRYFLSLSRNKVRDFCIFWLCLVELNAWLVVTSQCYVWVFFSFFLLILRLFLMLYTNFNVPGNQFASLLWQGRGRDWISLLAEPGRQTPLWLRGKRR